MGDKITIKLVAANLEKRQLDFEWIPGENSIKKENKKKAAPQKGNNSRIFNWLIVYSIFIKGNFLA